MKLDYDTNTGFLPTLKKVRKRDTSTINHLPSPATTPFSLHLLHSPFTIRPFTFQSNKTNTHPNQHLLTFFRETLFTQKRLKIQYTWQNGSIFRFRWDTRYVWQELTPKFYYRIWSGFQNVIYPEEKWTNSRCHGAKQAVTLVSKLTFSWIRVTGCHEFEVEGAKEKELSRGEWSILEKPKRKREG